MKTYKFFTVNVTVITVVLTVCLFSASQAQVLEVLKEINTTGSNSSSFPFDFTEANNKLFFIAEGNTGGYGLWITTGTTASTQMISPATGPINGISDIIAYNNKIYFAYDDGVNGLEIWVSDGTAGGTVLFKDLYPGNTGSFPRAFTVANNKLFFVANNTDGEKRLYVSDGTAAGTGVIKNVYVDVFNGYTDFAVLNNDIYFRGDNGSGAGYGIWKSDGTAAGTVLLKPDVIPGVTGGSYAVLDNKLYFSAVDNINGSELWVSDGTTAGTHLVVNLSADGGGIFGNGSPDNLRIYNNKLYFTARDDLHGVELFVTDGTAGGTQVVKDIIPGAEGSVPTQSMVYNGFLYFSCGGESAGLWKTDGSEAGTVPVKTGLYYARFPAIWNGKLYIVLSTGDNYAVWQTDGSTAGTVPIQLQNTVNPVSSLNNDFKFKEYNGSLYLSASCNGVTLGFEPAKISGGSLPLHLISFDGRVEGDQDVLNWTTSDEVNTAYFSVQHFNGTTFKPVATVQASVNRTGLTAYHYAYPSVSNPSGLYRLQMVDKDGTFTYSPVVRVQRTANNKITAKFNPASKQIIITNNSRSVCHWKLVAMNGSSIKQGHSADPLVMINTTGIAAGTYVVYCTVLKETVLARIQIL